MSARGFGLVVVVTSLASGCALVSGLSSLDVQGAPPPEAGVDASTDVTSEAKADADAGGSCDCLTTAPPGFSPVLFAPSTSTACPGSTTKEDLVLSPKVLTASGPCSCSCTVGGCLGGMLRFNDGSGCAGVLGSVATNGACQVGPSNFNLTNSLRMVQQGSATCSVTPAAFPPASSGTARVCSAAGSPSGCAAVCTPTPGLQSCFETSGDVACPNGLTKYGVGASITDTRSCAGCTCAVASGTCTTSVQFYVDANCTASTGVLLSLSNTDCLTTTVPSAQFVAKVTANGTCSMLPGTASGSTAPVGVRTICCK